MTTRRSIGAVARRFTAEGRRAAVRSRLMALPEGWITAPATPAAAGAGAGAVQLSTMVRQRGHRSAAGTPTARA